MARWFTYRCLECGYEVQTDPHGKQVPVPSVLWLASGNRIIPLFHRTMGDDASFPEHMFDIFNVRNVDRAHRETYFLEAIEHYRPDLTKTVDAKKRVVYRLNVPDTPKSEPQQQNLWKDGDPV